MRFDLKALAKMVPNVGEKERKPRYIAGGVLIALAFVFASWLLLILGAVLVFSAYRTWCPVYAVMGKNTCDKGQTGGAGQAGGPH